MKLHSSRTQLSALGFVYTSLWRKENKMFAAGWWDVYTTWLNKSFSFYTACLWREKIDGSIVAIYIQRLIHIRVCQILGFFSFHPPFRVYSAFLLIRKKKKTSFKARLQLSIYTFFSWCHDDGRCKWIFHLLVTREQHISVSF